MGQPLNQVRGGKTSLTRALHRVDSGLTVQVNSTAGCEAGREALSHQTSDYTGQNVTGASGSQPRIGEG